MQIIYDYPPNYKAIAAVFNIKDNPGIVFTYGNKLYVPAGERIAIDKALMRHEETHAHQQRDMGAEAWWERFLADPAWRLAQELEAYRNQYRAMANMELQQRMGYVTHIAKDLSGEMYGNLMTFEEAVDAITEGIILKRPSRRNSNKAARKFKKQQRNNRKKGRK